MKTVFTYLLFVILIAPGFSQLQTADIAFTGFNADGDDDIAFVAFSDIPANTTIYFCDSEWNGDSFGDDENDVIWISGDQDILAGTIIQINHLDGEIEVNHGSVSGGTGLSKNGDALFAYIGTDIRQPSTFLSAISNISSGFGDLTGTGLKLGFTAIVLTETADVAAYSGPRSGIDANGYFSYINDMENWDIQDTDDDNDHNDAVAPDLPFSTEAFIFSDTDVTPPYVLDIEVISSSILNVYFSEALTEISATHLENYVFTPNIGISEVIYDDETKAVTISHEGLFNGISTVLEISNLEDTSGNKMTSVYTSEGFFLNTSSPELLITEIMYNVPVDFDDDVEFLEILNNGDDEAQLGGIIVKDEGNFVFTFPEMILAPGATVLLATNKEVADTFYNAEFIDMVANSGNMLGNGGELLQIINTNDEVLFEVEYDDADLWDASADGSGPSLELINPDLEANDGSNWKASTTLVKNVDGVDIFASPGMYTPVVVATVSFTEQFVSQSENGGVFLVDVGLTDSTEDTARVSVTLIENLTNASVTDYVFADTVITFLPEGDLIQTISITLNDNSLEEMDKMIVLSLSDAENCLLGGNTDFVGYILDDEESAPVGANTLGMEYVGSYLVDVEGTAEIVAYDSSSQRLFVLNSEAVKVEVLDFSDPLNITEIAELDMSNYGAGATSVAVHDGIVAATVENGPDADGVVVLFDINGIEITNLLVGNLPDMVTFTPAGDYILIANEGQPADEYSVDPEGSISMIDISADIENVTQEDVLNINFNAFDQDSLALVNAGVRIFGLGSSVSQDLEPEFITISDDGSYAWISLQENNAIAVLNLETKTIEKFFPLGAKDHSLPANVLDVSDDTDDIIFSTHPVKGLFMPDAIANYTVDGVTYIVTANEGDQREYGVIDEDVSIGDGSYILDTEAFPHAEIMKKDYVLGRLAVSPYSGDTDGDGDFDEIYVFGGRSFSIWNSSTGALEYDSGSDFEKITANDSVYGELFNASNSNNNFKNRSDNKGPEPEGVTIATIGEKFYAFITLERTGGVMVYDITDPTAAFFETYINSRQLGDDEGGDLGPEGIIYITPASSPIDTAMVVVANEVSSTISIYYLKNVSNEVSSTENLAKLNFDELHIYPNPTASKIFFDQPTTFTIYDMSGVRIINAENKAFVDLSGIASGHYIVVTNDGKKAKLIIE
ncbi:choice-of-anchor I family protein [Portibacter lacus]|uniref:LTD domain-containing protein n=1 Tax=Portibacter lacus TaxID=1099794 RepID=A0AA37WGY0_9BACT|nr:choice-of-anchor I family protein [Portibacter lacus]GLR18270.1 hypothetical protein GCM10007940_28860 [Portibacter lacus]